MSVITWVQRFLPRAVRAKRGWCLGYVDDAGAAPSRTASARVALNVESRAKRLSTATPPLNIWVVGYLDLRAGPWLSYDHVFLMKYRGNGKYEIRDSETESGFRSRYVNISSILAWFGNYNPAYVGWSYMTDGRKWAEKIVAATPVKKPAPKAVYVTVKRGWGLSNVAQAAGYKDYNSSKRWAAIAALNGSNDWKKFNAGLDPGEKVRVR